jgi:hypothetical protein
LMMGSDDEGTYIFSLIDQNTLDYCYSETGRSPRSVRKADPSALTAALVVTSRVSLGRACLVARANSTLQVCLLRARVPGEFILLSTLFLKCC